MNENTRPMNRPLRTVAPRDFGAPNAEARARAKARAQHKGPQYRFAWPENIRRLARLIGLECDEVARELAAQEAGQ